MNLKKHLDRAEQALDKGQPDFAAELCDQVLDFAPGEQRAANLLAKAVLACAGEKSKLLGKIGSGPASFAAQFQKLIRNPDGEARSMRRAFMRDPHSVKKGISWADALERAGYASAALGAYSALAKLSGAAARAAGDLSAAHGEIEEALGHYQVALDINPRDTAAMRARKNLAAEQALQNKQYGDESASGLDTDAFRRAALGEDS
ncbi:MAG: tetratricopeptide (TPR) repeat protein [Myxococcota bacterium]|jgi:tetratricopeptide (TPR) repeat protein